MKLKLLVRLMLQLTMLLKPVLMVVLVKFRRVVLVASVKTEPLFGGFITELLKL